MMEAVGISETSAISTRLHGAASPKIVIFKVISVFG
jgi:hypothetical protein